MKRLIVVLSSILMMVTVAYASPATGDYSHMTLWITLFAIAAVVLLSLLAIMIHKNSKKK